MKKRSVLTSIGLTVLVLSSGIAYGQSFDLIIKNAMLLDGRGGKAVHADVGIESGKITKIGDMAAERLLKLRKMLSLANQKNHVVALDYSNIRY